MEARLQDHEVVVINEVCETVFFADASGPNSGEHVAKWLWLADA